MARSPAIVRTHWAGSEQPSEQLALPLSRSQVLAAADRWGTDLRSNHVRKNKRLEWLCQWQAIETIASDIWSTHPKDEERLRRLWVMLTWAVGNFKRQGGMVISPLPVPWSLAPLGGRFSRRDSLSIPVGDGREPLTLTVDGTTQELRGTSGLASVPTGSTLLSALWPDEHAIFDIRDFRVAVGLLAQQGVHIVDPESTARLPDPNWDEYRWFRQLVKHEAIRLDLPSPQHLERALYVASDLKPARSAVGMSWRQLGTAILEQWP